MPFGGTAAFDVSKSMWNAPCQAVCVFIGLPSKRTLTQTLEKKLNYFTKNLINN